MRPLLLAATLLLSGALTAAAQDIPRPTPDELIPGMAMYAEGRVTIDTLSTAETDSICREAGFEANPTIYFLSCSIVGADSCRVLISNEVHDSLIRYLLTMHEIAYCGGWRPL